MKTKKTIGFFIKGLMVILLMYNSQSVYSQNYKISSFDWRNAHGQNWITDTRCQLPCHMGCVIFAVTASAEAVTNLYFNQHFDLDLKERALIADPDFKVDGDCNTGWYFQDVLYQYKRISIPDENGSKKIKINSYEKLGYPNITPEKLKKWLIKYGPLPIVFGGQSHAVTLIGFYIDDSNTTNWIYKNSLGNDANGNCAGSIDTSSSVDINPPERNRNAYAYAIKTPIYWYGSNPDIVCTDNDLDGYYYWGIGDKPANCPPCPDEPDGDDSNPYLGPFVNYDSYKPLSPNDEPCGAITINEFGVDYIGYVAGSTYSGSLSTGCNFNYPCNDVWFKFNASLSGSPITIQTKQFDNGCAGEGQIAVYRGGNCNNLNLIKCSYNEYDMPTISLTGVDYTPGELLYVRYAFDWGLVDWNSVNPEEFKFKIKVSEPFNDYPCTANTLNVKKVFTPVTGSFIGAHSSNVPDPNCGYLNGNDVWYAVKVPQHGNITFECREYQNYDDACMAVYSGTCSNLYLLDCDDVSGEGWMPKITLHNRAPGEILYARVFPLEGIEYYPSGKFYISAYYDFNDDPCFADNLIVESGYTPILGSFAGSTSSNVPNPGCGWYDGLDVWYSVNVPENGIITVECGRIQTYDDACMAVYSGTCSNLYLLDCDDDSGEGWMPKINLNNRVPGETLYVRVFPYNDGGPSCGDNFYISAYSPNGGELKSANASLLDITSTLENKPVINKTTESDKSELLQIYPNPAKDYLAIDYTGELPVIIKVINILGNEFVFQMNEPKLKISTGDLKTGLYIVKLVPVNQTESRNVIIKQLIIE